MIEQLKEESYDVVENVKSRDFYRVTVNDFLQLDFVNDRVLILVLILTLPYCTLNIRSQTATMESYFHTQSLHHQKQ